MLFEPPLRTYRYRSARLSARSVGPIPVAVTLPVTNVSAPSRVTAYVLIVLLFVFVAMANRPSRVVAIQHTADSPFATEPETSFRRDARVSEYDETALAPTAPPNASETISSPPRVKSKPNGVSPFERSTRGSPVRPFSRTG